MFPRTMELQDCPAAARSWRPRSACSCRSSGTPSRWRWSRPSTVSFGTLYLSLSLSLYIYICIERERDNASTTTNNNSNNYTSNTTKTTNDTAWWVAWYSGLAILIQHQLLFVKPEREWRHTSGDLFICCYEFILYTHYLFRIIYFDLCVII